MVERPGILPMPEGDALVFGHIRHMPRFDTRFLGWLLLGVVSGLILYDIRRWQVISSLADLLLPLSGLIAAVLLIRLGEGPVNTTRPLLHVSSDRQWVTRFGPGDPEVIDMARVTHVVFGMIDYTLPKHPGVDLEAFALYLAQDDGTPIAVVDASADRLGTYRLAQALASLLGRPMIQLGKGIQE